MVSVVLEGDWQEAHRKLRIIRGRDGGVGKAYCSSSLEPLEVISVAILRSHECAVERQLHIILLREVQRRSQHALRPRLLASGSCARRCEKILCKRIRSVLLGDLLAEVLGRFIDSCIWTCLSHAKNTSSKTVLPHIGQIVPSNCSARGSGRQVLSICIDGRSSNSIRSNCCLPGIVLHLAVQTNDRKFQSRALLPDGHISLLAVVSVRKLGIIDQAVGLIRCTSPLTAIIICDREVYWSRPRRNRNSRRRSHNCLPRSWINICLTLRPPSCNTILATDSYQRHLQKAQHKHHCPDARQYGHRPSLSRALHSIYYELRLLVVVG